jgi:hypothetical protein
VCENLIKKRIHTGIAKNAKERMNYGSKGLQFQSGLSDLAISVCKNPIRKEDPHGGAANKVS